MLLTAGISTIKHCPSQIFENLFMITIVCSIFAVPIEREPRADSQYESFLANIQSEREKVISDIKTKILSRLNYSQLPKFNKTFDWTTLPSEMKRLLNDEMMFEDSMDNNYDSKIETIITTLMTMNSCDDSSNNNNNKNQQCLNLTIPNLDNKEIVSAKLIIPLKSSWDGETFNFNVTINSQSDYNADMSITKASGVSLTLDWTQLIKTLLHDNDSFESVKRLVTWQVIISASEQGVRLERIMDLREIILDIQYKNHPKIIRKKRSTNTCQSNQFFCCTERLKVSIEDLGWSDFIMAPRSFTINYCRGDCNNYIVHSSNHARAVNAVRNKGLETRREVRSCCVPYSYENLNIMYLKPDNNLAVATFNDLIASSCGCL